MPFAGKSIPASHASAACWFTHQAAVRRAAQCRRPTGMTRVGIYKALAPEGNPTFATLMRITRALGLQVRITL